MSANSVTIIPHGSGTPDNSAVRADAFYPELSTNAFRDAMRVDTTVPHERVELALINAVLKVNVDLAPFKAKQSQYITLADIPSQPVTIGETETTAYQHHYKSAVFNEAKASITERYRDIDSTNTGHDEADKLDLTIDDYRADSREHIRAILGNPRATIKLL